LALGVVLVLVGCNVYSPGWSTIHADGANTDYSPVAGPDQVELAWVRNFDGNMNVGATIDREGRLYLTENSADCNLHVLEPTTGATVWCSDEVDRFSSISSPLIDNEGRVFLADGEAMHAFDRDGNLLWEVPIEGVPLSAQFTQNGRLLFMTHIGRIYVLRRETGAPVLPVVELIPGATWDPSQGVLACAQGLEACPAANTIGIDISRGRFYFTFWAPGAPQAGLRAMQITESPTPTLTPLWTSDALPGGSASSPVISADGSRVYVNDNVDSVHALDAATGATIWSEPIGYASGGSPSMSPRGLIMPAGGGTSPLLAISDQGDHADRAWTRSDLLNRGLPTQTAGDRSYATVNAGGFTNDLLVIDTTTGAVLDRDAIPGTTIFSVGTTVGPDGSIYVPTITGDLYAFRPV
jgi:outer membrane protein assembly factor BamB